MKVVLWIVAILSMLISFVEAAGAKNPVTEIDAMLILIIAVIAMVGASILGAMGTHAEAISGLRKDLATVRDTLAERLPGGAVPDASAEEVAVIPLPPLPPVDPLSPEALSATLPAGASRAEHIREFAKRHGITSSAAGYHWQGQTFGSFDLVVDAIRATAPAVGQEQAAR